MKIIGDSSYRSTDLNNFGFVEIADQEASAITGGLALVGIDAIARAYGPSTYTRGLAVTRSRSFGLFSIAYGGGSAIAIGDRPAANVDVFGIGDQTIGVTQTHQISDKFTLSTGFVVAIDHPFW
jgi:hypothetical protein